MSHRPIFYDTETTGLKPDKDRIIEIAAYDPIQDRGFTELINPQIPIPPDTILVHNITEKMVTNAPLFSEVANRFVEFCAGEVILIAHNNDSFDLPFLLAEFERNGLIFPEWKFIDSLKWARKYRYDLPRHSLQYLREVYEIPPNQAHRALNDVMILKEVFQLMTQDLPLSTIISLLDEPPPSSTSELKNMPFGKYAGSPLEQIPQSYIDWLHKNGAFDKQENKALKEALIKLNRVQA